MRRVCTICIRGQSVPVYECDRVLVDGQEMDGACDPPDRTRRSIYIRKGLDPLRRLDVLYHEMLHFALWDLSEEAIEEIGTDLAMATETVLNYRWKRLPNHGHRKR